MKVEIWSDIMCPFCYIGKREFEKALEKFSGKDQLEIEWRSYQLSPDLVTAPDKNIDEYLAESKGISVDEAHNMNNYVTQRAKEVGLDYHFDKAIPANTMKAHCLTHFAKKYGKQNKAEELLFRSYFTEGKNIDDVNTLLELGAELGLDTEKLKTDLTDETYYEEVRADIYEAYQLGVKGVPFFVFDRKYAVSGAQPDQVFTQTLEQSFKEWTDSQKKNKLNIIEGETCSTDGECS